MTKSFRRLVATVAGICIIIALTSCSETKEADKATSGEKTKLSYWVVLDSNAATTVSDYGETPLAKELEKRLGIDVEYQHPPQGRSAEKFNIMVAMDEMPDIVEAIWTSYPGGPGRAISEGTIKDISKNMEKAPNLAKYLSGNKEVDKLSKTDKGELFGFPFIRGDKSLQTSAGIVVRKDWLDDLNMKVPETIDEWETVLKVFKQKKGSAAPLSMLTTQLSWGAFTSAYGVIQGTYVDNGTIKYGSVEPGFKEFLKLFSRWYKEGLLDSNIASLDSKTVDAKILNGTTGATGGSLGSGIGRWMASATQPGYNLVAAPYPTLVKGVKPEYGNMQLAVPSSFAAITKSCKNIDAAYKFLDYGYSDEGHMLFNFGIEGESYNMVNGYPKYTEYITNNLEKLSMTAAMSRYMKSYNSGPFVQDKRYMEQYAALPQQQEAWKVWSNTNAGNHILPYLYIEDGQAGEIAKLENSVTTYESEMIIKFIMGIEPIENFDKFVSDMNTRGLSKILQAKQVAYEGYLNR